MNNRATRERLLASTIIAGTMLIAAPAFAQTSAQSSETKCGASGMDPCPPGGTSTVGTPSDATAPGATQGALESQAPETAGTGGAPGGSSGGDIIVTGSRIPQPNLTSASPVSVVNSQEIKLEGATRIEDVLNSLPSVFADGQGSTINNGSNGTATLDLRGLGEQRTLVLIDGRRIAPGNPNPKGGVATSVADINIIPDIMVKRVDVLTGGASATYGADAVSGVVNFIMDTDFEGLSVDGQYGLFIHNNGNSIQSTVRAANDPTPSGMSADGRNREFQAKFGAGTSDGRGHVVGYIGYRKTQPVLQGARDYSACTLREASDTGFACRGSATSYPGSFYNNVDADPVTVGPDRSFIANPPTYNYGPINYLQRQDKRYTAGFFAHYDVSDSFKPYAEFMFMDDSTIERDAPGGDFNDAPLQTNRTNCDNPLLGASQLAFICQPGNLVTNADGSLFTTINPVTGTPSTYGHLLSYRRNVEGGARVEQYSHDEYRGVVGVKGEIAKGVTYDAYGQYGQTTFFEQIDGYFQGTHINNALDVVAGADGNPVCRSVISGTDPNCVPYDIFSLGGVTQGALNYLTVRTFYQGKTREKIASGSLTFKGDEYGLQSPLASSGIGVNVGGEYRREDLNFQTDTLTQSGDISGGSGTVPNVTGAFNVKELFGEIQVPLISDRPFFQELSINAAYRYSHYSTAGNTSTYKILGTWSPIKQITVRGGYNRAVRAPDLGELFNPATVGLTTASDPCEGATPSFTQAQCTLLGVPAAKYGNVAVNPSGQYNDLSGGNVQLKPEKADTYTAGVILQPMRNFNVTVDAYRIKLTQAIGGLGFSNILNACGTAGVLCNLIHRDANATLWQTTNGYVDDANLNFGSLTTQGIDVTADYVYRTDKYGSISANVIGTYLDKLAINEPGIAKYDCAGYFGSICGIPSPKWRSKARLTWTTPWNVAISGQWRYFGKTKEDALSSAASLNGSVPTYAIDDHIKAYSYFDLTLTARVSDQLSLRMGATNILDKDPPIFGTVAAPSGNGNTFSQSYDSLGRYVFMGASMDF